MKAVGVILTLLMITVTTEASACENPSHGYFNFIKLNSDPVCFGAKNSQFGSFKALTGGKLMKIKLVHLYGYISCAGTQAQYWSHWGCGYFNARGTVDWTSISVTTAGNSVLFPPDDIKRGPFHWSLIPGYTSRTPELVMSIYDTPQEIIAGQELRVWYSEDLFDHAEGNNYGRVCADVYGYFM